jgi:class 3 adenylate cyclase
LPNDECLRILDENLALEFQDQSKMFNEQVRAILHRSAATGAIGPARHEVIDLARRILRSRVEHIITILSTLPFEYSDDLDTRISEISLKYFPPNLEGFGRGIGEIINVSQGNPNVRERISNEITRSNEIEIRRFQNGLDKYLLNIKIKGETQTNDFVQWAGSDLMTLAILFTDVVGSTVLSQKLGAELMESVRQAHFKQTRKLLSKYGGWEIKTIGDSFMVAFHNAANSLDFAMELHLNTGHPQIKIRVGIHIGPIQIKDNDAYGNTVNFADRIKSIIKEDEIWISDRAKEDIDLLHANRHQNLKWKRHEGMEMRSFPGKYTLYSLNLLDIH